MSEESKTKEIIRLKNIRIKSLKIKNLRPKPFIIKNLTPKRCQARKEVKHA